GRGRGSLRRRDVPAGDDASGRRRPAPGRRRRDSRSDAGRRVHDRRRRSARARCGARRHGDVHDDAVADLRRWRRTLRSLRVHVGGPDRPRRRRARGAVKARYLEGARAIAPIGIAGFAFALSFGVLARTAGMGWAAPLVMSATTFAGSAQFAVASLLHDGGAAAAAIAAAVMLNARYVPISISVASRFESPVPRRLLEAQLIVDESWAVALKRRGGFDVRVLLGAGALLYL